MIRTLLAQRGALARGALAFVLGAEPDIEVVAEVERFEEVTTSVLAHRPDVGVIDLGLLRLDVVPRLWALRHTVPGCHLLVLAEARLSRALRPVIAGQAPGLGFLATDGPPGRLVAAVRKVASGEPVLDSELVVSAVRAHTPLTPRETEVLSVAAEGVPVAEIAERLMLSQGTVRNHLSRVAGKVDARTRIEAVRIAQEAGWI